MTFIGLGKTVGGIFNHATAGLMLAPPHAGKALQDAVFNNPTFGGIVKKAGKQLNLTNPDERFYGAAGELSEKVDIPRLAHHASEYLAKQVTPENQALGAVMDNAADILSTHIGPIAQWGSQALQALL
jgi:hypothetical protein